MDNLTERLDYIDKKLENIENIIEKKIEPLLDLLQVVINTNIATDKIRDEPQNTTQLNELMYIEQNDTVYISGTKTYFNRDLIKATFKGSSWDKEKTAWSFKKFPEYEDIMLQVFPNIVRGQ